MLPQSNGTAIRTASRLGQHLDANGNSGGMHLEISDLKKPGYFWSPTTFLARTRNGIVALNLRTNQYLGLSSADFSVLAKCVGGPPPLTVNQEQIVATSPDTDTKIMQSAITEGVITTQPMSRQIVSTTIDLGGTLISIGDEIVEKTPLRIVDVIAFLSCLFLSATAVRVLPLQQIVKIVYRRRRAATARGYRFNSTKASRVVYRFRAIRPYYFLAKDRCLVHALTLVNFMALYDEYPAWVFGVGTDPWTAHSWVQQDNFLLDCNPEKVVNLEPILAV